MRPEATGRVRGALAHQLVDVAVEVVVERRSAAAGEREAEHRHCEHAPRRHARGADERGRAAGQQQQRHHARLGQRDVVVEVDARRRRGSRAGLRAEEHRGAEGERRDCEVHARLGQQRREPEQDERRDRSGQQPPRGDPGEDDEPGERRQRERREQLVRGAPVGGAGDDGEAGPATAATASSRAQGPIAVPLTGASPPAARRRSRSGRALVIGGMRSKFHAGGGELAYHSSVSASHGSCPARLPVRAVLITFATNTSMPSGDHVRADRRDHVVGLPEAARIVRVDAPRHPHQPEQVLRQERHVEADEDEPELQLPELLVEHPAEQLRPPVGEAAEDREERAAEEHVVQVRDDEVRVRDVPVDREDGEEDPREAAEGDDGDEAERPQHRRVERDVAVAGASRAS